jgi:hypothetical protein
VSGGEPEGERLAAEPGHERRLVGQARGDQAGTVDACVEGDDDAVRFDVDARGAVEEIAEEALGLGAGVFTPNALCHEAIEGGPAVKVGIDLEPDHGRARVEVEELDRLEHVVLDEQALGVAGDQAGRAGPLVIRHQDGRLFVAHVEDLVRLVGLGDAGANPSVVGVCGIRG